MEYARAYSPCCVCPAELPVQYRSPATRLNCLLPPDTSDHGTFSIHPKVPHRLSVVVCIFYLIFRVGFTFNDTGPYVMTISILLLT